MAPTTPDSISGALRRFVVVYALASSSSILKGVRKGDIRAVLRLLPNSVRIALFPALVPLIYSTTKRIIVRSQLAAILSSPLLLLLPSSIRLYFVVFALTAALRAFAEGVKKDASEGHDTKETGWRKYLPPIWTLAIGNTIMLPLWVLGPPGSFPKGYDRILLAFSRSYYREGPTPNAPHGLKSLLAGTTFPLSSPASTSGHTYEVCAALHPSQPSCLRTYIGAVVSESLGAVKLLSMFELASVLLKKGPKAFGPDYVTTTVIKTARNVAGWCLYTGGGISSSWFSVCVLQRLIPEGRLLRARFVLGGLFNLPWILAVPASRRNELSMYMFRAMLFNLASVYRNIHGTKGLRLVGVKFSSSAYNLKLSYRTAELAFFASSWWALLLLREKQYKLEGSVSRILDFLESPSTV
ncbi:hypothetical protein DL93DRAFT_2066116 [Clavulina sp. PMI_390]|nr:hypothetical protein DL93DRAFT_2066116 [Clavulina sp. PMI_390]